MDSLTKDDCAALAGLLPAALLVLDRRAQLHYANPAAQALLARLTMLSVKQGTLTARRKGEDRELRDALASVNADNPSATVCFRNREGLPMVVIDVHLLQGGLIAWRITDLASRAAPSAARLRHIFGLTAAEARVARAMVSGSGIQAVARDHGVEAETVRTQVKRLRAKTGARSQNQLISILATLGLGLGPPPAENEAELR